MNEVQKENLHNTTIYYAQTSSKEQVPCALISVNLSTGTILEQNLCMERKRYHRYFFFYLSGVRQQQSVQ